MVENILVRFYGLFDLAVRLARILRYYLAAFGAISVITGLVKYYRGTLPEPHMMAANFGTGSAILILALPILFFAVVVTDPKLRLRYASARSMKQISEFNRAFVDVIRRK